MNNISINNTQISRNFNKIATQYLANTNIQKVTAKHLADNILNNHINDDSLILDLGSGPGTLLHTQLTANVILYDLSLAMLHHGTKISKNTAICGDALSLPFANASFDYVISNLMLQWVINNKSLCFTEIFRILKPNGRLIFTTLIQPSLWQLKNAWQEFDNITHHIGAHTLGHTLNFNSFNDYKNQLQAHEFLTINYGISEHTMHFDSYFDIMHHFKQTGTTIPQQNKSGLYTANILKKLENIYIKKFGTSMGLPLSYHYAWFKVSK